MAHLRDTAAAGLLRPFWLEGRKEGLAARVGLLPLEPAALYIRWMGGLRHALYRRGWLPRRRLACRVVSVGSLTVGGAAKTPISAWLAFQLQRRGHRVVLASRGYRRARIEPVTVVSDGRVVHGDLRRSGDEPLLLAAQAPGVPVLVGPDRGVVGLRAISLFAAEVLVLDDGLQHHRLARDVEIVIVDASHGFGNRRIMPRGPLREPLSGLARAQAVVVVDGDLPSEEADLLDRFAPAAPRFRARRRPTSLRSIAGGASVSPEVLDGLEVGMLAGIARPAGFRRTLEALGARVVAERRFRDHHRYRACDLRDLPSPPEIWLTTEKDAVKILPSWPRGRDLRVLRIAIELERPDALLDWLEARLACVAESSHF